MSSNKTAVVFPGQGSQKPGMARDFFDEYESARRIFGDASDAIGEDLQKICFDEDPRLDLTEFTQPSILTAEAAMLEVLRQNFNFKSDYFAGHSLGEYTALVAADVIPFRDAVQIVRKRGALMQKAVPAGVGAMAAIILTDIENTEVKKMVQESGAELANLNSLEQYVISGKKAAVEAAAASVGKKYADSGVNVVFLPVSAPFHSSLMKEIEPEFRNYLESFASNFKTSNCVSVVSNFSSGFHTPEKLVDNLVSQISGSVQWIENMRLLGASASVIYEVGPNRPLGKFFRTVGVEINSIINLRSAKKAFEG